MDPAAVEPRVAEVQAGLKEQQASLTELGKDLQVRGVPPEELGAFTELRTGLTNLAAQLEGIRQAIGQAAPTAQSPPITPEALATQFVGVMETIQTQARQSGDRPIAGTIKSFDIELKAIVTLQNEQPQVILPTAEAPIDPNKLSTIRMSFGTIPRVPGSAEATE